MVIAALYSDDNRLADRVDGGPKWIDTDAYDIEGKVLEGDPSQDVLKAMARSLLEDRFQLKIRREVQQGPVYDLVVANSDGRLGRQLTSSTGDDCTTDPRAAFVKKVPMCGLGLPMSATEVGVSGCGESVLMPGVWLPRERCPGCGLDTDCAWPDDTQ